MPGTDATPAMREAICRNLRRSRSVMGNVPTLVQGCCQSYCHVGVLIQGRENRILRERSRRTVP